jgi:DNA recombination protein RmuC
MESFHRLISDDNEQSVTKDRKEFIRTVKQHIDHIAQKYILPDEGTYDFALMYIPAENIYYETIIKDKQGDELFPYAMEKRVIPVSPNSLYAYLQVIVFGLKGMHIEEKAKEIMNQLARLRGDEGKFREEFNTLGGHLKNARNKFEEAEQKLARFEDKMLEVSTTKPAELPPGEE